VRFSTYRNLGILGRGQVSFKDVLEIDDRSKLGALKSFRVARILAICPFFYFSRRARYWDESNAVEAGLKNKKNKKTIPSTNKKYSQVNNTATKPFAHHIVTARSGIRRQK
jgi:hypothetical protein